MGSNVKNSKRNPQKKTSSESAKLRSRPRKKVIKSSSSTRTQKNKTSALKECTKTNSLNISVLHYIRMGSYGERINPKLKLLEKSCIINQISRYRTLNETSFERRVTSIAWHPIYSQIAAAGSKGGELGLYNFTLSDGGRKSFIEGIGPGGSVVGLKFNQDDPSLVYTCSITGEIRQEDFNGKVGKTLLSSMSFQNWFSSLDVCYERKLLLAGDCTGNCYLLNYQGEKVWKTLKRMHKGKVTHVEFSPADSSIFATSSTDHTVKLWDMRMMGDSYKPTPTRVLPHLKAVNSAYFSPSNHHSLLTTDQHSEIKIFKSPCWEEELIIKHPHRQFQHLTPIKATWHPIEDIVVVGRYPDVNFLNPDQRTIDFYDGSTGDLLYRHRIKACENIVTLNAFNNNGDCLASGAGCTLVFLKDCDVLDAIAKKYRFLKLS